MPFRPLNTNHAIEMAGFSLIFDRSLDGAEWEAISHNYHLWLDILPAVQFENNPERFASFSFLQPNGKASWRMEIEDNQIVIFCHQYTNWSHVKLQVLKLFSFVMGVVLNASSRALAVSSISLEIDDVFINNNRDEYKLSDLFVQKSPRFLQSIFDTGCYWEQEVFTKVDWTSIFECLERIELGGSRMVSKFKDDRGDFSKINIVRLKHIQLLQPLKQKVMLKGVMSSKAKILSVELDKMHAKNKNLLQEILVEGMQQEISLNTGEKNV